MSNSGTFMHIQLHAPTHTCTHTNIYIQMYHTYSITPVVNIRHNSLLFSVDVLSSRVISTSAEMHMQGKLIIFT